jgi:undecaprenyl diphosphate synthase
VAATPMDRGSAGAAPAEGPGSADSASAARAVEPAFDPLPNHVAIIMDGNRRWARERGLPEVEGHAAGVEAVRRTVSHAIRRGIPMLSLYAFSRENWGRSDAEVSGLLTLLESAIRMETPELVEQGVEVRLLGRIDELPDETRRSIESALDATRTGARLKLNIAFNYAGRAEIVDAVRAIVRSGVPADAVDEGTVAAALYTAGMPDPDLVIRTGGEQRLSNFLIWQSAYAEFVSTPVQWPAFGGEALDDALSDFARRSRRFGR